MIHNKAMADHVRYCDISRGCYTVLEDHQNKCTVCLHKARIYDRKRHGKKRQDKTLCLDCGNPLTSESQAKGLRNRLLRRCMICYEKLQQVEKKRPSRDRNYKAEAFQNKHVIWNHYVKGAKKRSIHFTLTKAQFESLILQPCFYCGYQKESEVNGLDRLDNQLGYIEENVKPCCQICNDMKGTQHPLEFIDKLTAIHDYYETKVPISTNLIEKWSNTFQSKTKPCYRSYIKSANTRSIAFSLSNEDFIWMTNQPCYLCGIPVSDMNDNGIDRVNNAEGYTMDNCKGCCGHCNLLKKTHHLDKLRFISKKVKDRYTILLEALSEKQIPVRQSKIEPRKRVTDDLISTSSIPMEYKSINEPIPSQISCIPEEIKQCFEMNNKENIPPKQWKTSMIYCSIQQNQENNYKIYCEAKNDMSLLPTWESDWADFIQSIRGESKDVATPIITAFIENLRRIRHNTLCHDKNSSIVEKENRQQWPATTVVRAFLDGKIDIFKTFIETSTHEDPSDQKWIKRWMGFIESLEKARDQPDKMKTLCSKFMRAQRAKKYRHSLTKSK
jgi:ribosomal protein L34E